MMLTDSPKRTSMRFIPAFPETVSSKHVMFMLSVIDRLVEAGGQLSHMATSGPELGIRTERDIRKLKKTQITNLLN